ncbi:MAG: SUMF1/EgtB/PvdO family nonheme iron enzyme, partial [Spirochaetales bacterium]|nr:SUMF1/EgtB/PvdO family nonheme iron enzyme [Spirochaetales bacterium]
QEMYEDAQNALEILGLKLDIPYSGLAESKTTGITDEQIPEIKAKSTSLKTDFFTLEGYEIPEAQFSNGKTVEATYPSVIKAGRTVSTQAFSIGAYCVTEYQFAQFLSQNPEWSIENKEKLISDGLVDEYYLDGVSTSLSAVTNKPVRNISWHAAQAFCTWLSAVSGRQVYLPSEDQWIAASFTDSEGGFQRSLMPSAAEKAPAAMLGSVWEMTGTRFIPMARIADEATLSQALETLDTFDSNTDMVIKGGSYVSDMSSIDRYSTGVAYRSLCSDYMGFRVAWN